MKRLILFVFIILTLSIAIAMLTNTPNDLSSSERRAFKEQVRTAIDPLPVDWKQIVFDEVERKAIRLTLVYWGLQHRDQSKLGSEN